MSKQIKVLLVVSLAFFISIFPMFAAAGASTVDPASDLAEALIYWQEQAVMLATENAVLSAENERLTSENEKLKLTLNDAEMLIVDLRSDLNEMAINVEKMNSLRLQAENALSLANVTIKQLEDTIKKLSGARFGLLLGVNYLSGEFGGVAGVTINF